MSEDLEAKYQKALNKLRESTPNWKLKEELGALLMKPVHLLTRKEKKRIAEIKGKLAESNPKSYE